MSVNQQTASRPVLVLFEVTVKEGCMEAYLRQGAGIKPLIAGAEGFIRAGRFQSLSNSRTLLGITEWKDEASVQAWRNVLEHRLAQKAGRESFFEDYTITVASSLRRYTMSDRKEAPEDSNRFHGAGPEAV